MPLEFGFIRCSSCGALNRISKEKLNSHIQCGSCKKDIAPYASSLEASDATFDREVLKWPGAVLLDFWTPTCGFCKQMMPIVQSIATEKASLLKVVTMNAQANPSTAAQFRIQGVPAFYIFQNGRMINHLDGALPKHQFENWIERSFG